MSGLISVITTFVNGVLNFISILVGIVMFMLYAIKSIFSLALKVILKIFSLSYWDSFGDLFNDLSLYLGEYTILLVSIFVIICLILFYKFILGLFKGRSEGKYKEY